MAELFERERAMETAQDPKGPDVSFETPLLA
jgi:hypothetical protein